MARRRVRGKVPIVPTISGNFDSFYKGLGDLAKYSISLAAVLGAWAGNKNNAVFPRALAGKHKLNILEAINTGGASIGQSWDKPHQGYERWKAANWGTTKSWDLAGNVKGNIVYRKSGSGWVCGLDRRVRVPRVQYQRGGGTKQGSRIALEQYAAAVEFGSPLNSNPKALFGPALLKTVQEDYPKLVRIVDQSIKSAIKIMAPKEKTLSAAVGFSAEDLISQSTRESAGGFGQEHIVDALRGENSGFDTRNDKYSDAANKKKWEKEQVAQMKTFLAGVSDPEERKKIEDFVLKNGAAT